MEKDILNEQEDIDISGLEDTLDVEIALRQVNLNNGVIAGVYIYADAKSNEIRVSNIGTTEQCDYLSSVFIDFKTNKGDN